jgi:alkanesulfonate monooxygenase SsuD/methylene tetrahydromethanopterin reductase-like flavin-dependent oxidoreductase (luciferase family)
VNHMNYREWMSHAGGLSPMTSIHTLQRLDGGRVDFVVSPSGNEVEVWPDGVWGGERDIRYAASRSEWDRVPLRQPLPVEWVREFWRELTRDGGFTLVNPCEKQP